jgi:CBS domain-containing protein
MEYMSPDHDYVDAGTPLHRHLREDFQLEHVDRTPVRDLMTPILFTVNLDTPASKVVEEMLLLKVHRLFVVDDNGVLVGVITALDILRHMHFQPVGNSLE